MYRFIYLHYKAGMAANMRQVFVLEKKLESHAKKIKQDRLKISES